MTLPSEFDENHFPISRQFINDCIAHYLEHFVVDGSSVMDIGGQEKYSFEDRYTIFNFDIDPESNADYVGDITRSNSNIPDQSFDSIICTDVLEHVVDPFAAVREMRRLVRVGGTILVTTPFNARIHGPIPDCWRFTEFGLKVLFRDFEFMEFKKLDTPGRNLCPLHYCLVVRKLDLEDKESDPRDLIFQKVS